MYLIQRTVAALQYLYSSALNLPAHFFSTTKHPIHPNQGSGLRALRYVLWAGPKPTFCWVLLFWFQPKNWSWNIYIDCGYFQKLKLQIPEATLWSPQILYASMDLPSTIWRSQPARVLVGSAAQVPLNCGTTHSHRRKITQPPIA